MNNRSETQGGALACTENASPMVTGCIFISNEAGQSGGALYTSNSNPMVTNSTFSANHAVSGHGGAIHCRSSLPVISSCQFNDNIAHLEGGAVYLEDSDTVISPQNSFANNRGCGGADLATNRSTGNLINATNNTFAGAANSEYFILPLNRFNVTGHISAQSLLESDVFVAPNGDDQTNDGLSPASPFRTIRHALSRIQPSSGSPFTIHLMAGEYSTATNGELFPLPTLSNIRIEGEATHNTLINSHDSAGMFRSRFNQAHHLSVMSLTGNIGPGLYLSESQGTYDHIIIDSFVNTSYGAGVYSNNSESIWTECNFQNCYASTTGGAVYSKSGSITFNQCIFESNSARQQGGAVTVNNEILTVTGCSFFGNTSPAGGAIRVDRGQSSVTISNSVFDGNISPRGANLSSASLPTVPMTATNNTFDVSPDNSWSVAPVTAFDTSNATITGPVPLPGATVYVSENGDNTQDGLTPDTAFRTISFAVMRVVGTDSQPAIINVDDGLYTTASGELFPLTLTPNTTLQGSGMVNCLIESDTGGAIVAHYSNNSILDGFSITATNDSCITSEYSSPLLRNLRIHDCNAPTNGAGLIASNGNPVIEDCIFENNHSNRHGGAIQVSIDTHLVVENTDFIGNSARNHGGGLLVGYNGSADVQNCLFQDNVANQDGGGLAAYFGVVHVGNTHFFNNTAGNVGGGAYVSTVDSSFALAPNLFMNNKAITGADLGSTEQFDPPVDLGTSQFSGIPESAYYIVPSSAFDISAVTGTMTPIQQPIYVSPTGDDDNSGLLPEEPFQTLRHALGQILPPSAESPLTVHLLSGTHMLLPDGPINQLPLLDNVILCGTSPAETILDASSVAGAFYGILTNGTQLQNLTLRDATGTAVQTYFCGLTVNNCVFDSNSTNGSGGALSVSGGTTMLMDSRFINNFSSSNGGAFDARQYAILLFDSVIFDDNQSGSTGGALSTWLCRGWMHNCDFIDNHSLLGGAWSSRQDAVLTLTGSRIQGNEAALGGGLSIDQGDALIRDCLITDNLSAPATQIEGHGGGIYVSNSHVDILSCTIASNEADGFSRISGGGLCIVNNSDAFIFNSIIRQNRAPSGGDIQVGYRWSSASGAIDYSNMDSMNPAALGVAEGSSFEVGDSVQDADPLFVTIDHNWHLSSTWSGQMVDSPCIDAGWEPAILVTYLTPTGIENLAWRTTESGFWPDDDFQDLGYHAPLPTGLMSGDLNLDGQVTWEDVQLTFLQVFENPPLSYFEICRVDMNYDQVITMKDAQMVARKIENIEHVSDR